MNISEGSSVTITRASAGILQDMTARCQSAKDGRQPNSSHHLGGTSGSGIDAMPGILAFCNLAPAAIYRRVLAYPGQMKLQSTCKVKCQEQIKSVHVQYNVPVDIPTLQHVQGHSISLDSLYIILCLVAVNSMRSIQRYPLDYRTLQLIVRQHFDPHFL